MKVTLTFHDHAVDWSITTASLEEAATIIYHEIEREQFGDLANPATDIEHASDN